MSAEVEPARLDLSARQNADFRRRLSFTDQNGDPLDLTFFVIDADITDTADRTIVATFTHEFVDASTGVFDLILPKSTSVNLAPGIYGWDLSLTSGIGERQYYLTGELTIIRTRSREGQP